MANAKQCDVCKKLYSYSEAPKPKTFEGETHKVNAISIKAQKGNKKLDVCKSCMKGFAEQLSAFYSEIPMCAN